jgi:hypothetical protein
MPLLGAALEIFPPENKKPLWFHVRKKKQKKHASRANRTTQDNPEIAHF